MKIQDEFKRGAGILLPIFSLPSPYGIGTFGKEAYEFVDFLFESKQKYWQVLPLGSTSYGDSPYQSFSAFAGNPYFIDFDILIEENLLNLDDVIQYNFGNDSQYVDYGAIYESKFKVLKIAFRNSNHKNDVRFLDFIQQNNWIDDYALFMTIKNIFDGKSWQEWDDDAKFRDNTYIKSCLEKYSDEIDFWKFCQYKFFSQWNDLKTYANKKGIKIIGDIPIYVAMDSVDVWVNFDLFMLDEKREPKTVAGVPPDCFSETGQLWGNPLYDWEKMEKDDFCWWKKRINASKELFDIIRIDHFIGIVNYYSINAYEDTAMIGNWIKGPSDKLIDAIKQEIGETDIIAEDLGIVTDEVRALMKRNNYPGMKLIQFGFESNGENAFLPCNFEKNCIAYGGTHDNETLKGFFSEFQNENMLKNAREYLNVEKNDDIPEAIIRAGFSSSANTVIYQMQDIMLLDNSARMNTPSTFGVNWKWRLCKNQIEHKHIEKLLMYTRVYGR